MTLSKSTPPNQGKAVGLDLYLPVLWARQGHCNFLRDGLNPLLSTSSSQPHPHRNQPIVARALHPQDLRPPMGPHRQQEGLQ